MPSIDRSKLPNAFEFVTVVSARARQLLRGCTPKVEGGTKTARIAEREVIAGEVFSVSPPSAPPKG
jgi:DNA-directed RNA polymerase subunit K/omega